MLGYDGADALIEWVLSALPPQTVYWLSSCRGCWTIGLADEREAVGLFAYLRQWVRVCLALREKRRWKSDAKPRTGFNATSPTIV